MVILLYKDININEHTPMRDDTPLITNIDFRPTENQIEYFIITMQLDSGEIVAEKYDIVHLPAFLNKTTGRLDKQRLLSEAAEEIIVTHFNRYLIFDEQYDWNETALQMIANQHTGAEYQPEKVYGVGCSADYKNIPLVNLFYHPLPDKTYNLTLVNNICNNIPIPSNPNPPFISRIIHGFFALNIKEFEALCSEMKPSDLTLDFQLSLIEVFDVLMKEGNEHLNDRSEKLKIVMQSIDKNCTNKLTLRPFFEYSILISNEESDPRRRAYMACFSNATDLGVFSIRAQHMVIDYLCLTKPDNWLIDNIKNMEKLSTERKMYVDTPAMVNPRTIPKNNTGGIDLSLLNKDLESINSLLHDLNKKTKDGKKYTLEYLLEIIDEKFKSHCEEDSYDLKERLHEMEAFGQISFLQSPWLAGFAIPTTPDYQNTAQSNQENQTPRKKRMLYTFFVKMMNQYHFKESNKNKKIFSFYGFISNDDANNFLEKGGLFIDKGIGTAVSHGKFTHLLQILLIHLANEDNNVDLKLNYDLTLIIALLTQTKLTWFDDRSAWDALIDSFDYKTIRGPLQLFSYITKNYEEKNTFVKMLLRREIKDICSQARFLGTTVTQQAASLLLHSNYFTSHPSFFRKKMKKIKDAHGYAANEDLPNAFDENDKPMLST